MTIIGDVHGKVNEYWKLLSKLENSIQVGDFGFEMHHEWHLENIDHTKHKINFGNHDNYNYLYHPHSLSDFSNSKEIMTVRGADSIDKDYRIEGLTWWRNEELSYEVMQEALDYYSFFKPKIMVTHDCPQSVREHMFNIHDKSMTSNGLQAMFEKHQPDIWIFGHHHKNKNEIINGTRFICLNELETFTL